MTVKPWACNSRWRTTPFHPTSGPRRVKKVRYASIGVGRTGVARGCHAPRWRHRLTVFLSTPTSLTTRDVQVVRDATALGASISFSPFGAPEAGYTLDMPLIDETTATGLTQELRVASDTERVAWVLGAFYSTAEREYGQSARAEDYVAVNSGAVSDFLRDVTGSPDLSWAGSRTLAGHPGTEELFFSDLTYDFNQLALFGEVSLAVTDRFSLTGGLRWYDFDERRTQTFDGLFADPLDSDGTTTAAGVAPRVIASYAMTEATQVNAQVSKGFRLGGINDPLNTPLCTPRDLETFGDRPHTGTTKRSGITRWAPSPPSWAAVGR